MRESFIFYRTFYEALKELPDDARLRLYDAITAYALNGEKVAISGLEKAVFALVEPRIKANNQRRENGCKGGAPKGNFNARKTTENQPKNNRKSTENQPNKSFGCFIKETTPLKERSKENNTPVQENYTPLFISPHGVEEKKDCELFFEKYPRYAKDRFKMREDVDYKRLIEEFEKSTYLRSLYTVKQINENYPLIVAGDFRDKEKQVDGATAGRELMAARERWYTAKRIQAEKRAEEVYNRFMLSEEFRKIERRLKELMPEMARLEVDLEKGNVKARDKLVKLEQERCRLKQQKTDIIERNGMSEEDFKVQYDCAKCNDTGFKKDGTLCDCYLED